MTTDQLPETFAERAEMARDLEADARSMLGAIAQRQEWDVIDASPRRKMAVLYSMVDGMAVEVFEHEVGNALGRLLPDGRRMFTASRGRAPRYKPGAILFFLHPDSPDAPVLAEIGIFGSCEANELRTLNSKRTHAKRRHSQAWEAYQEHLSHQRDEEWRLQTRQQLEATLALAEKASGVDEAPAHQAAGHQTGRTAPSRGRREEQS